MWYSLSSYSNVSCPQMDYHFVIRFYAAVFLCTAEIYSSFASILLHTRMMNPTFHIRTEEQTMTDQPEKLDLTSHDIVGDTRQEQPLSKTVSVTSLKTV